MAKTKFLSKVLAVLMVLSMLCSTGVFADYNSGITVGDAAVTGVITPTTVLLNDKVNLDAAKQVELAKWADITEGIKVRLAGTTSAQTGTLTYLIAPVDTLAEEPLDIDKMATDTVVIGYTDIKDGAFDVTFEADKAKLATLAEAGKNTFELRFAYSKSELADVTDASELVYQRYIKTFDWSKAATATRTITKDIIGNVSIKIDSNPLRDAAADVISNVAQRDGTKASVLHIRTDNLTDGALLNFSASSYIPSDFKWAGETTKAGVNSCYAARQSMLINVGSKLKGGVVLALPTGEVSKGFKKDADYGYSQLGNVAYRFTASAAGTLYIATNDSHYGNEAYGFTKLSTDVTGMPTTRYNYASRNYLFVKKQVTEGTASEVLAADLVAAGGVWGGKKYTTAPNYTNTAYVTKSAEDAIGYYIGGGSNSNCAVDGTFSAANTAYLTANGLWQLPSANLDENGNWIMSDDKPYGVSALTNYGYTDGRGWLTQTRELANTYERKFQAGEVVEIPYGAAVNANEKTVAILKFDVPKPELASATVATTLNKVYALKLNASGKYEAMTDAGTTTVPVAKEADAYVVKVPYGTGAATVTVADALGRTAVVEVAFQNKNSVVTTDTVAKTVVIDDNEYDVTFKWDDTYPYVITLSDAGLTYKDRSFVQRAGGATTIWSSHEGGNKNLLGYTGDNVAKTSGFAIAAAGAADTVISVNGKALSNNGYLTVITPSYSDSFDRTQQKGYSDDFHKIAHVENAEWMSFYPSAAGTVYVSVTHANASEQDFVWKEGAAAGWTKVADATVSGKEANVYQKRFAAGEKVMIPSQVITEAEVNYINEKIAEKDAANADGYNFKYVYDNGYALLNYSTDGGESWTPVGDKGGAQTKVGNISLWPDYLRGNTNGAMTRLGVHGTLGFFVVAAFDQPFAMGDISYTIGEETDVVEFEDGATEATVVVPYGTASLNVAAAYSGAGDVTVEPATVELTDAAPSQTVTVTATPVGGTATEYTVTFKWGAPSITWESALALSGNPASGFKNGIYNVGNHSGTVALDEENPVADITVPYGVEAVVLNGATTVNLLANDGEKSVTMTLAGVEYTVNVKWAAYAYAEGMPPIYDLHFNVADKQNIADDTWYYVMPSKFNFSSDNDYVIPDNAKVVNTKQTEDTTDDEVVYEAGKWITYSSHNRATQLFSNGGSNLGRLHVAADSFADLAAAGDIKDKYALSGATWLKMHYKDKVDNGKELLNFKSAIDGYVIVGSNKANSALKAEDGWKKLTGASIKTSNQTTSANSSGTGNWYVVQDAEGNEVEITGAQSGSRQVGNWSSTYSELYIKKVEAGDPVSVSLTTYDDEMPPLVIIADEDMITERSEVPLELKSLAYTTALVDSSKYLTSSTTIDAANARDGGFYQPTLVTTATAVTIGEETTINVTVPYGTEIVELAGMDSYGAAVEFEAINLIDNNGVATVTKNVGEIEYTINIAWAAFGDADAEKNLVYDVKYGPTGTLTTGGEYNVLPTKLVLAETRLYPSETPAYKSDGSVSKEAGTWAPLIADYKINVTAKNGGNYSGLSLVNRGRLGTGSFAPWVEAGLITESGMVTGTPVVKGEEESDADFNARVDEIAYNAMNGAGLFVAYYEAIKDDTSTVEYTFNVAQDSVIYVNTKDSDLGTGWTKFEPTPELKLYNAANDEVYYQAEDGTYQSLGKGMITSFNFGFDSTQNKHTFYKYAKAGEIVVIDVSDKNGALPPVVFVRPVDFKNFAAPKLGAVTYQAGKGEATAVTFAEGETAATVAVPWGTETVSVQATAENGVAVVGEALNLKTAAGHTGTITVALENVVGEAAGEYTITFAWVATTTEYAKYASKNTIYKNGTVAGDVEIDGENNIVVPFGTSSAEVTYKLAAVEDAYVVTVDLSSGAGSAELDLPEGVVTVNFTVDKTLPNGQYVTNLKKNANADYKDRFFASFGAELGAVTSASGHVPGEMLLFVADKDYSDYVPAGIAKKGYVAVIADNATNRGHENMSQSTFKYLSGTYSAESEATAWLSFNVAADGMVYASSAREDGKWPEIVACGWTVAPFTTSDGQTVYQKKVKAGDPVYIPNNAFNAEEEIAYANAALEEQGANYRYAWLTADDSEAFTTYAQNKGTTLYRGGEGWAQKYTEEALAADPNLVNVNGFVVDMNLQKVAIVYYARKISPKIFAVADEFVDAKVKGPQWTGASTLDADGEIELKAAPIYYGEKSEDEITFAITAGDEYAEIVDGKLVAKRANYVKNATVELTLTQGDVSSKALITLAPISEQKYGYLTVKEAACEGGAVTGYVDGTAIFENALATKEFLMGTVVTLEAVADEGYEFVYWVRVDSNGSTIYNREATFDLAVPKNITVQAVFKQKGASVPTVTFMGYQGKIEASYAVDSVETITVPAATPVFGYTCDTYLLNGIEYKVGDVIAKELIDKDTTFTAVYVRNEEMAYTVTVVNGTVKGTEGATEAQVNYNVDITVVANEAPEGMKFSHWIDGNGQILSYDEAYKFYMAAADRKVEAVYVEQDEAVSAAPVVTMTVTEVDAEKNMMAMFAERRVPEQFTVVENGIVYGYVGNKFGLTEESASVDLDNYNGKKVSQYQNNNGQYTIRLEMNADRQSKGTWYASTYLIYKDTDGKNKTIYSDKVLLWKNEAADAE